MGPPVIDSYLAPQNPGPEESVTRPARRQREHSALVGLGAVTPNRLGHSR